jgi:hypothetical protein
VICPSGNRVEALQEIALSAQGQQRGSPGREAINLEASADVRFDAHNGLKSDIERRPKSAQPDVAM